MTPPWRASAREHFPGVPAWGAPTSRVALEEFPVAPLEGVTPDWAWAGADGDGVRACIVDSGVDPSHPLVGPIDEAMSIAVDAQNRVNVTRVEPADTAGHGTACASIIRSIAPKSSISSMQVLTDATTGSGAALLAGLDWAISAGFDLVNLSLSTTRPNFCQALYELADRAYFRRSTLVVSAHNMPVRSFPWPFASVISVASHDEPDSLLHYYNPGPPVEFYARGIRVPVAWRNGERIRSTGNSFAAPHITGLCCLILSKHPWLTPFQLKSALYLTARNVTAQLGANHATN